MLTTKASGIFFGDRQTLLSVCPGLMSFLISRQSEYCLPLPPPHRLAAQVFAAQDSRLWEPEPEFRDSVMHDNALPCQYLLTISHPEGGDKFGWICTPRLYLSLQMFIKKRERTSFEISIGISRTQQNSREIFRTFWLWSDFRSIRIVTWEHLKYTNCQDHGR